MELLNLHIDEQKYGDKTILHSIYQSYESGKIHGVLGENGAGKTTLFHCMADLIPYEGKTMFAGFADFGYLPAELYMYPMITGDEFLQFYVTAKGRIYQKDEKDRLNRLFELPLHEYADRYSTGMLKKLYLLGLLLQYNDSLLLDEPFNGLDFKSSAFMTALLCHCRDEGNTLFVASHDIEHLFSYADTISVIKDGGLVFYSDRDAFQQIKTDIENEASMKVKEALCLKS